MRARAVMPATSSASSGESVHCAASMLAMITSAICSTGMAGVPRTSGLTGPSRSRRPAEQEGTADHAQGADRGAREFLGRRAAVRGEHDAHLSPTTATTALKADIISMRSVTYSCAARLVLTASTITGEVDAATVPATTAVSQGAPSQPSARVTNRPASAACSSTLSASQRLSSSQRGAAACPARTAARRWRDR